EPADTLWIERLPKKFRDDAPHLFEQPWGELSFGSPRMQAIGASQFWAANKEWGKEGQHLMNAPISTARPGGWDPAARVKDMAEDTVVAEALYPSLGLSLFWVKEAEFQEACFSVYNDWMAEFVSYDPKRFIGLGMVSCYDIDNAVKELHRIHKAGLRG